MFSRHYRYMRGDQYSAGIMDRPRREGHAGPDRGKDLLEVRKY
jgi:hypothetical protein